MRPILNISISRTQIFRNFFSSDGGKLLSELQSHFRVNLLVPAELLNLVKESLRYYPLIQEDIEVYIIPRLPKLPRSLNILTKTSKYLMNADHIKIHIENSKNKDPLRRATMYILAKYISRIPLIKNLFRKLFSFLSVRSKYMNSFFSKLPECDAFFSTSLTDLIYESCLGIYYESKGAITLGTPRSWDNITSYGCILWFPHVILSHSDYMSSNLVNFQQVNTKNILQATAPNYRKKFLPQAGKSINQFRIGFACMGSMTNPDDLNVFQWIVSELAINFPKVSFIIFQHPKFKYHINFDIPKNVIVKTFMYESSTLQEYYSELASLSVLFAGGTSVLLDAEFCRVKTFFINFEILNQKFWSSALRYRDMWPHTRDFLDLNKVDFVNSKLEMESIIRAINVGNVINFKEVSAAQFIGKDEINYSDLIINTIKSLL
jgi:hypothetical protein